jgi:hypothetical protein
MPVMNLENAEVAEFECNDPASRVIEALTGSCSIKSRSVQRGVSMDTGSVESTICAYIARRPNLAATYTDLLVVTAPLLRDDKSLDQVLVKMVKTGKIRAEEDEERGTVYIAHS